MQPCLLTERPGEDLLRYAIGRLRKHRVVPFLRSAASAPGFVLLFISGCDAATLPQRVAARIGEITVFDYVCFKPGRYVVLSDT